MTIAFFSFENDFSKSKFSVNLHAEKMQTENDENLLSKFFYLVLQQQNKCVILLPRQIFVLEFWLYHKLDYPLLLLQIQIHFLQTYHLLKLSIILNGIGATMQNIIICIVKILYCISMHMTFYFQGRFPIKIWTKNSRWIQLLFLHIFKKLEFPMIFVLIAI